MLDVQAVYLAAHLLALIIKVETELEKCFFIGMIQELQSQKKIVNLTLLRGGSINFLTRLHPFPRFQKISSVTEVQPKF